MSSEQKPQSDHQPSGVASSALLACRCGAKSSQVIRAIGVTTGRATAIPVGATTPKATARRGTRLLPTTIVSRPTRKLRLRNDERSEE